MRCRRRFPPTTIYIWESLDNQWILRKMSYCKWRLTLESWWCRPYDHSLGSEASHWGHDSFIWSPQAPRQHLSRHLDRQLGLPNFCNIRSLWQLEIAARQPGTSQTLASSQFTHLAVSAMLVFVGRGRALLRFATKPFCLQRHFTVYPRQC